MATTKPTRIWAGPASAEKVGDWFSNAKEWLPSNATSYTISTCPPCEACGGENYTKGIDYPTAEPCPTCNGGKPCGCCVRCLVAAERERCARIVRNTIFTIPMSLDIQRKLLASAIVAEEIEIPTKEQQS